METTLDQDGPQHDDEDDPSLLLFAEREEAFLCIERLAIRDDDDDDKEPCDDQDKTAALLRLRTIFDKYQECQVLLDASLEDMIQALCRYRNSPYALSALYGLAKVRGFKTIQRFLPHAISDVHDVWSRLQKQTLRHDGEQRADIIDDPGDDDHHHHENPRPAAPAIAVWEGQYVLWLWMAALSLVPFDGAVLWGDDGANVFGRDLLQAAISQFTNPGLLREAAAYCLAHWLSRPDGQNVMRPRFVAWAQATVELYVDDDGRDPPQQQHHDNDNDHGLGHMVVGAQRQGDRQFQVLAILQTAVTLLKRHDPATVVEAMRGWCGIMQHLADHIVDYANNNDKKKKNVASSSSSALLQRYLIKWWTRWSCALLPPPCAWRYRPGQRSLFGNSNNNNASSSNDAIVAPSNTPSPDPTAAQEQQQEEVAVPEIESDDDDDDDDMRLPLVPNEVEQNMGRLLQLMSHAATAVRWSAAKGIGGITERLPQLCARDVLDAILASVVDDDDDYCSDAVGHYRSADNDDNNAADDTTWHGACLTLAELARRGLILPLWLPDVVPFLVRALQLERPSRHSAGAGVRDAACYTYWAFARAYRPIDLHPFLPELNEAIVLMSLFDRQVNCRRAASAAFQEAVGRQGATNVPHGLDILTVADYFTLGNRTNAYLFVAKDIAMLNNSPYRRSILRHLYTSKLYHWDPDIRTVASKSLNELALLDADYTHETIVPTLLDKALDVDVATRHGAILGLAEIIDATTRNEEQRQILISTSATMENLINLVPEIERRRLYRGRGGELVRGGVCRLVECLAKACVPLSVKDQVRLLDAIDSNIPHPSEAIQQIACQSVGALLVTYFPVGPNGPSDRLQSRVVDKFLAMASTSDNPAATRGYTLALGFLPAKLLAPSRDNLLKVLTGLKNLADPAATVGGEGDAETRRNALTALGQIVTTVGFGPREPRENDVERSYPHVVFDYALIELVFQIFVASLSDYKTDRRGDVGSWCRMEAMSCATALLQKLAASDATLSMISSEIVSGVVCAALRQMAEKLDSVRDRCSACLEELLLCTRIPIMHREKLLERPCKANSEQAWRDAVKPFAELVKLAEISDYTDSIMLGFIASIGGLGESLSKAAWEALLNWIRTQDMALVQRIGLGLVEILDQNGGRLFVPTLVTLDRLLSHRCLHDLIDQTDFCEVCVPRLILASATTKSVPRILAAVDAMISLAAVCDPERHSSERSLVFGCLCRLLIHSIPRVRKLVADSFYLLLMDLNHAEAAEQVVNLSWMTPSVGKTEQIAFSLNVVLSN